MASETCGAHSYALGALVEKDGVLEEPLQPMSALLVRSSQILSSVELS